MNLAKLNYDDNIPNNNRDEKILTMIKSPTYLKIKVGVLAVNIPLAVKDKVVTVIKEIRSCLSIGSSRKHRSRNFYKF